MDVLLNERDIEIITWVNLDPRNIITVSFENIQKANLGSSWKPVVKERKWTGTVFYFIGPEKAPYLANAKFLNFKSFSFLVDMYKMLFLLLK